MRLGFYFTFSLNNNCIPQTHIFKINIISDLTQNEQK